MIPIRKSTGGLALPAGGRPGQVLTNTGAGTGQWADDVTLPSMYGLSALSRLLRPLVVAGAGLTAVVLAGSVVTPGTGLIRVLEQLITRPTAAYTAPDGFAKDPTILKIGRTYYVYYTAIGSGNYGIGLAKGPSLTQLTHVQTWTFARRSWAPSVVAWGDKYYLFAGDIVSGTFRLKSDSPEGLWTNPTSVDDGHFDMSVQQIDGQWYAYATPLSNGAVHVAPMSSPTDTALTWTPILTLDPVAESDAHGVLEAPSVVTLPNGRLLLYYSIGNSDQPGAPRVALLPTPISPAVHLGQVGVERAAPGATTHLSVIDDDGMLRMMLCGNGSAGGTDFKLYAYEAAGNPAVFRSMARAAGLPASATDSLVHALPDGTVGASAGPPVGPHAPLTVLNTSASAVMSLTDVQRRTWQAGR